MCRANVERWAIMTEDLFDEIHQLLRKGRSQQALGLLTDADQTAIYPHYRFDLNHAWYLVGDIEFRRKNYKRAATAFRASLADRPDDVEAMMALANCYSEMGMPEYVEELLSRAIDAAPENSAIAFNLANSYFDQGKYRSALELFEKIAGTGGELAWRAKKSARRAREILRRQ